MSRSCCSPTPSTSRSPAPSTSPITRRRSRSAGRTCAIAGATLAEQELHEPRIPVGEGLRVELVRRVVRVALLRCAGRTEVGVDVLRRGNGITRAVLKEERDRGSGRDVVHRVDDRVGTDVCLELPGAETLAGDSDRGAQVSSARLDHGAAEPMIDTGERPGDGRAEAEANGSDARRIRT